VAGSRYWYRNMTEATTPEEFWRCSVLFAKIVDGRFDLRERDCGPSEETFSRFFSSVEDAVKSRVNKWQSARKSKLSAGPDLHARTAWEVSSVG
jgi:hypothetical protein